MQFLGFATLLAAASSAVLAYPTPAAQENKIIFQSVDDNNRTIYFTPNAGLEAIEPVSVPAGKQVNVTIPQAWIGNYYSITNGSENKPGMLGEVAFNGWNGLTYFDVSAIVNAEDHDGVAQMWPASSLAPTSGCRLFPCSNAYYIWDDVQTKATHETEIVTILGKSDKSDFGVKSLEAVEGSDPNAAVGYSVYKRSFVEGKW